MTVHLTRENNVATLTLDVPESLNALDDTLVETATQHLKALYADADLAAIILTGANGVFSSGGNLGMLHQLAQQLRDNPESAQQLAQGIQRSAGIIELLKASPVPTIAAIEGACAGAGIGWVAACDLRIASERSFFDTAYLKLGLGSDFGVSYLLSEVVGMAVAKDWLLRPRRIAASEAYARGFVTELHTDQEDLFQGAQDIAEFLASERKLGAQAIRANLAEVQQGISLSDHLARESERFITSLGAPTVTDQLAKITERSQ